MPRRKKKGKDMPPLDFLESPLYQDAPLPDHDYYETGNPATAKVVAVDALENIPWISPQFRRRSLCRASRTRKISKSLTRLRSKSEGSPSDYLSCHIKSKFPPLQCLQQRPKFAVNSDFESQSTTNLKHCSSYENLSNKNYQGTDNSLFNSNEKSKLKQKELKEVPNPIRSETERCLFQGCENSPLNGNDVEMKTAFPIPANTSDSQNRNQLIGEANSMDEMFQNSAQIQISSQHLTNNIPPAHCFLNRNGSHIDLQTNGGIPNGWDVSTPPRHSRHVPILAPDTPECDYGLTMRQRQLKYFYHSSKAYESKMIKGK